MCVVLEIRHFPGVCSSLLEDQPEVVAETPRLELVENEVELPGVQQEGNSSPNRGKMRPGKQVIKHQALDARQEVEKAIVVEKPVAVVEEQIVVEQGVKNNTPNVDSPVNGTGKKKPAALSMLERQALWLEKKKAKANAEKARQLEEAERELTFSPDLRRTSVDGGKVKTSTGLSGSKKSLLVRRKSIDEGKEEHVRPSSGSSQHSVNAATKETLSSKSRRKPARHIAKPKEPSLLDAIKSELKASTEKNTEALPTESIFTVENTPDSESQDLQSARTENSIVDVDDSASEATNITTARESEDLEREDLEEPLQEATNPKSVEEDKSSALEAQIQNFRFDDGSTSTKGRFKVRDAAYYDLNSMYRKRDKYAGRDGVSLQMGRHEETHTEHVLAIIFDKEKVSEKEAGAWWFSNRSRFVAD